MLCSSLSNHRFVVKQTVSRRRVTQEGIRHKSHEGMISTKLYLYFYLGNAGVNVPRSVISRICVFVDQLWLKSVKSFFFGAP